MIIGVTGSIGTGKTTVAKIFRKLGAYVIDADKIVHRVLSAPKRRKLRGFIFEDERALKMLCRVIHPLVKRDILLDIKKNSFQKAIVVDAPLLIESGFQAKCDYIVVVKATYQKQLERAGKNLSLSKNQIRKRLKLQMPLREKIARADFVIDNSGSLKNTEKQVKKIWKSLTRVIPIND